MPQIVKFKMPSGDFTKLLDAPSDVERARILDNFRREGAHIQPEPWLNSTSERSKMIPQSNSGKSLQSRFSELQSTIAGRERLINTLKTNPGNHPINRPEAVTRTVEDLEHQVSNAKGQLSTLMQQNKVRRIRKTASFVDLISYIN